MGTSASQLVLVGILVALAPYNCRRRGGKRERGETHFLAVRERGWVGRGEGGS